MSEDLSVVVWKWKKPGYRSSFDASTVNVARNMFESKLSIPHRFVCVTDDRTGIDERVSIVDIKTLPSYRWMGLLNPSNPRNPNCYVRLFMFSRAAAKVLGSKIISVDLDLVLTGDVTPLFSRDEDFVIWGGQARRPGKVDRYNWYNGSVVMHRPGTRTKVYTNFNPSISPIMAARAGCNGSDQGWIAYSLGDKEATFGYDEGIRSFRNHIIPNGGRLMPGTRIVAFHGKHDPWHADVQRNHAWVREHYR